MEIFNDIRGFSVCCPFIHIIHLHRFMFGFVMFPFLYWVLMWPNVSMTVVNLFMFDVRGWSDIFVWLSYRWHRRWSCVWVFYIYIPVIMLSLKFCCSSITDEFAASYQGWWYSLWILCGGRCRCRCYSRLMIWYCWWYDVDIDWWSI